MTSCSVCKKPINETGTAIDNWPCHIECYHTYTHHEWVSFLGMVVCNKCMKLQKRDELNPPCSGKFSINLRHKNG